MREVPSSTLRTAFAVGQWIKRERVVRGAGLH